MKTNEIEEAVKVVAEFMGYVVGAYDGIDCYIKRDQLTGKMCSVVEMGEYACYANDLDSLFPVWKERGVDGFEAFFDIMKKEWSYELLIWVNHNPDDCARWTGRSEIIQQAALLATAKAIKSLYNKRTENAGELE